MYGIVLKANWSEEPVSVNLKHASDNFQDGVSVNPDSVVATWPHDTIDKVRDISVTSTASGRRRQAFVVKEL